MFLLCMNAVCMFAQNPTLTADGNTKEYVYPKQGVSYHLNTEVKISLFYGLFLVVLLVQPQV